MKIDMHCHTFPVSKCAVLEYNDVIDNKIKAGYDGMVLTNHIQPGYFRHEDYYNFMLKHIDEFHKAYDYGKAHNFLVIFGVEVTINDGGYSDWLLYGISEEFLLKHLDLHTYTQKQLYGLCKQNNIVMIQAHPFRHFYGHYLKDINYMDGIELNTNSDIPYKSDIFKIVKDNKFLITCGTDYHDEPTPPIGGNILPDNIENSKDLYEYLSKSKECTIFIKDKEIVFNN